MYNRAYLYLQLLCEVDNVSDNLTLGNGTVNKIFSHNMSVHPDAISLGCFVHYFDLYYLLVIALMQNVLMPCMLIIPNPMIKCSQSF